MEVDLSSIMNCPEANPGQPLRNPEQDFHDNIDFDYEPPAPEPPTPQDDDMFGQERRRLILLIKLYTNEFPAKLSQYRNIDPENLTKKELENLKEEIEYTLGARQNVSVAVNGVLMGIGVFEKVATSFTPLKIHGFSQAIASDTEAVDDVKALCIKHMGAVSVEPEMRVAMRLFSTALQLHAINTMREASEVKPQVAPVDVPDPSGKYADL